MKSAIRLTSIAGSVSMLSGVPEMNEEHRQLLQIVTRESERLNSIITDFLAYSRGKQYQFDRVDLMPLAGRHADPAGAPHGGREHRASASSGDSTFAAGLDARRWRQDQAGVLEFLRERGARHEGRRRADRGRRVIWATTGRSTSPIPGTGMTPQQIEKIFEPFQSELRRRHRTWVWLSCTRSCRRTKARCGRVRSLGKEPHLFCDCAA